MCVKLISADITEIFFIKMDPALFVNSNRATFVQPKGVVVISNDVSQKKSGGAFYRCLRTERFLQLFLYSMAQRLARPNLCLQNGTRRAISPIVIGPKVKAILNKSGLKDDES